MAHNFKDKYKYLVWMISSTANLIPRPKNLITAGMLNGQSFYYSLLWNVKRWIFREDKLGDSDYNSVLETCRESFRLHFLFEEIVNRCRSINGGDDQLLKFSAKILIFFQITICRSDGAANWCREIGGSNPSRALHEIISHFKLS